MAYIPPPGDNVVLWFEVVTPPPGDAVVLWFGDRPIGAQILVYGIDSLEIGDHYVDFRNRTLLPVGIGSAAYGLPTIFTSQQACQPQGFSDEAVGQPIVILKLQQIGLVSGIDGLTFGFSRPTDPSDKGLRIRSTIGPTQTVRPAGINPTAFGTHLIAFWLRYLTFTGGNDMLRMGSTKIDYAVRHIFVPWFYATQIGTARLGYTIEVAPYGFDRSALGTPDVSPGNIRRMHGWLSQELGEPEVRMVRRVITVQQWDEKDKFGEALIFNKKQIIYVDNQQFFTYYPYFSNYNDVSNRNRTITPESIVQPRMPIEHRVILTGQQVLPKMGEMTEWGDAMVGYSVRHIYPDTSHFFAGYIDPYHFVHNYAIQRTMEGIDSLQVPTQHRVWFNAQSIAPRSIVATEYGTAFVAYNPRYIQQLSPDFGLGLAAGKPWVSALARAVIVPPWTPPYMFGTAVFRSHKNVLNAFPISYVDYGVPRVANVTPQLYPSMVTQTTYGNAWVSHSPRTLQPDGIPPGYMGDTAVTFRTRTIHLSGIYQFVLPRPTVRKQVEDTVHDQTIDVGGFETLQMGTLASDPHPFPRGWESLEFGITWIRVQGCIPYWDFPDSFFQFGIPSLNASQTATETNKDGERGAQTGWPDAPFYHRISPHTIYCTFDTPLQAILNNPQSPYTWKPLDTGINGLFPPPPWFGNATVTTPSTQIVAPWHSTDSGDSMMGGFVGHPFVEDSIRFVYVFGINSLRFMFPTLPHSETLWIEAWEALEFGTPKVGLQPAVTQHIRPAGFNSAIFGAQHVENFNRQVFPAGFNAIAFGNNNPMVYHYPRGVTAHGADSAIVSDQAWISFYIRYLTVPGFDSFAEGYTFGKFKDRMRVTQPHTPPTFSVGDASRFGIPDVSLGLGAPQRIGPYMIPPPELCHPHSLEFA